MPASRSSASLRTWIRVTDRIGNHLRMPKRSKPVAADPEGDPEIRILALLATCVSFLAFLIYYQRGEITLYGDAVAHMNIARRVFDSKTPGLLQLGTVWLPLPHLLMIPFLISKDLWQRGAGGSIPSMIAYVLGVVGIFRLVRESLARGTTPAIAARLASWAAALVFAANPNLIYMQATAMGESLYLAFFVWAAVFLREFLDGDAKAAVKCALCLAAACLTRYDGWFLSFAISGVVAVFWILSRGNAARFPGMDFSSILRFVLICAAAPILWLAYNGIVYKNPLEFENGPYSAKAIERRTQAEGNAGHPGSGNLILAGQYFLKAAEVNMAESSWLERAWILLLPVAAIALWQFRWGDPAPAPVRWGAPLALAVLLIPIPFYALSVAYGGVPIFIPPWWPFTHYNVRYGLQLLPAFSVAFGLVIFCILHYVRHKRLRIAATLLLFLLLGFSWAGVWRATPVCLQEAQINMRTRNRLEAQLSTFLSKLPTNATVLMYLGDHVGALQKAGIPLSHVINEGNHRVWMQPSDPQGLWERALANPTAFADYIVAFEGDPVWQAVHDLHLRELVEIHVTGQARAILYRVR